MSNEKVLQNQEKPTPAQRQGFAGRMNLLEGLFEGAKHKNEEDILASRFVYETVKQLVDAKAVLSRYEAALMEEASEICRKRATAAAAAPAQEQSQAAKPANEDEALVAGIRRIGVDAVVKSKKTAPSGNFLFNVVVAGRDCHVMLPKETMESEDPAALAESMARTQGVQSYEAGRSSRPPASTDGLGVDKSELERRKMTYEGDLRGQLHFTYLKGKIESTFCISETFSGRGLLAELDRRIFMQHLQFGVPFEPGPLEAAAESMRTTKRVDSIGQGQMKAVAKALHLLLVGTEIEERHVPKEYLEAWQRLKASSDFQEFNLMTSRGVITKEEARAFTDAFNKVAHPTHETLRSWFMLSVGEGNEMSEFDLSMLRTIIDQSERNPLGLCERALRNLYDAYALLYGDGHSFDMAQLEQKHLFMTVSIKRGIEDVIPPELRRLVE